MRTKALLSSLLALVCAFCLAIAVFAAEKPSIKILSPAMRGSGGPDAMGLISGTVTGAPAGAEVCVFAYAGRLWWLQPYLDDFKVPISGQAWTTKTHLGEKYVAFVVKKSFQTKSPLNELPAVGGDVLARSDEVEGK